MAFHRGTKPESYFEFRKVLPKASLATVHSKGDDATGQDNGMAPYPNELDSFAPVCFLEFDMTLF